MNLIDDFPAKSNGKTIRQHTDDLKNAFENFKNIYGDLFKEDILTAIQLACEYHDYGKCSLLFQKRIGNYIDSDENKKILSVYADNGFKENIPHGYLSPAFMDLKEIEYRIGRELMKAVVNAVYYHHNRKDEISGGQLRKIISADFKQRFGIGNFLYPKYLYNKNISDEEWMLYAIVVGMLNKMDYYASDTNEKLPVEIDGIVNDKYINDFVLNDFKNKGFHINAVQQYMWENSDKNIVVTASTGIGKTEGALLWNSRGKLFYTLPLKVSINAMYRRLCTAYGYDEKKVTLLHSDFVSQLENSENIKLKYDASKRLSYPLTVCTIDQLFTFVYKYRGCEMFFATLKYSKVVIDEIQSYSPDIIAKIVYGLKLITQAGGKFAVITATLPDVLVYFMKSEKIDCEFSKQFLLDKQRHRIKYDAAEDFDYDSILNRSRTNKVLVIVNTVKRACEVYSKLKSENENTYLLHSRFIRKHRNMLEKKIMNFSKGDENGVWVTTQLVEASLDIDFDFLYTEMCPADSLLQRMGRCYRKREYSENEPNVIIVDDHNGYGTVYKFKDIYDGSAEFLKPYDNSFFSEKEKAEYISRVFDTQKLKEQKSDYFKEIKDEIHTLKNLCAFDFSKEEAKQKFRNINSYRIIPKEIYDENIDMFDEMYSILCGTKKRTFAERQKAKEFFEDNSLSLDFRDPRVRERNSSILEKSQYYTLNYKYDFDEKNICGLGLTYDRYEENMIW